MEPQDFPRVELRGHNLDLENLAAVLRDGSPRVCADGGMFWLHSADFDGLAGDPDKARLKAAELLPLINGVAKARIPSFHPVELGPCVDWVQSDGQAKRRLTATITVHVRSAERVANDARVGEEIGGWVALARDCGTHGDVLSLWGSAHVHDWSTLYRIREKIRAAAGGRIIQRGWATRAELRRFDHTANSAAVLGSAARHGVQKGSPPATPTTIDEAHELIERLIRRWITDLETDC